MKRLQLWARAIKTVGTQLTTTTFRQLGDWGKSIRALGVNVFDTVSTKLADFGSAIKSLGLKATVAGAGVLGALTAAAKSAGTFGQNMLLASERTGVSIEALQGLRFAAAQSGIGFDALIGGIEGLNQKIVDASLNAGQAQLDFLNLGLSWQELSKMPADQRILKVADALKRIPRVEVQTHLAQQLGVGSLLPMLRNGAQGIQGFVSEMQKLGIMTKEDAEAGRIFTQSWTRMTFVLEALKNAIGSAIIPVFTDLLASALPYVRLATEWIRENKGVVVSFLKIGAAVLAGGIALKALAPVVSLAGSLFAGLGAALKPVISLLTEGISLAGKLFSGVIGVGMKLVFAAAKTGISILADSLSLVSSAVLNITKAFMKLGSLIVHVGVNAGEILSTLAKTSVSLASSVVSLAVSLKASIAAAAAGIVAGIVPALTAALGPIAGLILSGLALKGIFSHLASAAKGAGSAVAGSWDGIKSSTASGIAAIRDAARSAWPEIKNASITAFRGISEAAAAAWPAIKSTALTTWGGIVDAFQSGDLKLAAEIAWAGVKVAGLQAFEVLKVAWMEVSTWFKSMWSTLSTEFAVIMGKIELQAKNILGRIIVEIKKAIADFRYEQHYTDPIRRDRDKLDAEIKERQKRSAREKKQAEEEEAIRGAGQADQEKIAKERTDQLARSNKSGSPALDAARAELDRLVNEAKQKREQKAKDAANQIEQGKNKLPEMSGLAVSRTTAGTFSAAAATRLAGGNLDQQQLDRLKGIEKVLIDIRKDRARLGNGFVFG